MDHRQPKEQWVREEEDFLLEALAQGFITQDEYTRELTRLHVAAYGYDETEWEGKPL
jgi:hypothetical protein